MEKLCSTCKKSFPATPEFFGPDKRRPTGFQCQCRKCAYKSCKKYAQSHREVIHKCAKKERVKHAQKYNERSKRWYYANRERSKAYRKLHYNKEWNDKHREQIRAHTRNRRAKEQNAIGTHKPKDIENIYLSQDGKCKYCDKPVGNKFHVDHIVPISRGGTNYPNNLVITCQSCNDSKGNKFLSEWRDGKFISLLTNL
jgi:5-methylcytosine-specific restriction endonuclease McrA